MNIQALTVFSSVGKHLNLTRVSEALHLSQPSITRYLKMVEEDFQAKLYDRARHGIQLTDAGTRLLTDVNLALKQLDTLKVNFSKPNAVIKDQVLVVGGGHGPAATLLPSVLAVFNQKHPEVRLGIKTGTKRVLEKLILKGQLDIAVVNLSPRSPELTGESYRKEKFVLFALAGDLWTESKKLTPAEFAQVPIIIRQAVPKRGAIQAILSQTESYGLKANIVLRCDSFDSVKTAVRRKMGLGILYLDAVEPDIKRGEFKIIGVSGIKFESESYLIYHKERALSAHALEFLNLLRNSSESAPSRSRVAA